MLSSETNDGFLKSTENTPSTLVDSIRKNHKDSINFLVCASFATSLFAVSPAIAEEKRSENMITCHSADKKTTRTINPGQFLTQDEAKRKFLFDKDIKKPWTNPLGIAQKKYELEMCSRAIACDKSPKCS